MPSYKVHNRFNLLLVLPLAATFIYLYLHPSRFQLGLFIGCFVYGTLFMSPDMDVANKIRLFSLRGILSIPFKSYALFFKHRGISHHFFLGTLTRVAWLFMYTALALYLFDKAVLSQKQAMTFYRVYKYELLYSFAAIFLADLSHIALDKSKVKKR